MYISIFHKRALMLGWALFLVIAGSIVVSAATFRMLQPVQNDVLFYSGANIEISFAMRPEEYGIGYEGISFVIVNKSTHPIAIDWDRSSITLPNGQTSNVMHEGTLFISRSTSTPPTTIPPGGKLYDSALPTRNVFYSDGWQIQSMAIKTGSQFGLYLTLSDDETTSGYNFTFEAVKVEELVKAEPKLSALSAGFFLLLITLAPLAILVGLLYLASPGL